MFKRGHRVTSVVLALSLACGVSGVALLLGVLSTASEAYRTSYDARIVGLMEVNASSAVRFSPETGAFLSWTSALTSFESLEAFVADDTTVTVGGVATHLRALHASPGLLDLVDPPNLLAGRMLRASEPDESAVVISQSFADTSFGNAVAAVGRPLSIDGRSFVVVGVAARPFVTAAAPIDKIDVLSRIDYSRVPRVSVLGRLTPESSLAGAQSELDAWATSFEPRSARRKWVVMSQADMSDPTAIKTLQLAAAGAATLLSVTLLNWGHLFVTQSHQMRREMAVRWAAGATPLRLVAARMWMFGEIWILACVASVLLSSWAANILRLAAPPDMLLLNELDVSWTLAAGPLVLVFLCAGLVALRDAFNSDDAFLRQLRDDRRFLGVFGHRWLGAAYVAALMCVTSVLCVAALLTTQSLRSMNRLDLGFDVVDLQVATIRLPDWKYSTQEALSRFYIDLVERLRSDPRLAGCVLASTAPMKTGIFPGEVVFGRGEVLASFPSIGLVLVGPGYFHTIKQTLVAGREFTADDARLSAAVVVVSQRASRVFGTPASALGKQIRFGSDWREIVGVVSDVRAPGLVEDLKGMQVYWPLSRFRSTATILVS